MTMLYNQMDHCTVHLLGIHSLFIYVNIGIQIATSIYLLYCIQYNTYLLWFMIMKQLYKLPQARSNLAQTTKEKLGSPK